MNDQNNVNCGESIVLQDFQFDRYNIRQSIFRNDVNKIIFHFLNPEKAKRETFLFPF